MKSYWNIMSTLVSDSLGMPCSELRPEPEQVKARAHGRSWDEPWRRWS